MQDPLPENIDGSKRTVHRVEHHVNWGYVIGGLAVFALAVVLWQMVDLDSEDSEDDETPDFS